MLIAGPVSAGGAVVRAKRILGGLTLREFRARGVSLDVRASIGVTVAPSDGRTLSDLLQHADVAMYQAKRARSGVTRYDAANDEHSPTASRRCRTCARRCSRTSLHVRYQPVIAAGSHGLTGFEALLRWHHPERGLLLPAEFIPIAERTSLIHALTRWVLLTAVRDASRWRQAGLEASIAVNISPVSLEHGLLGIVEEVLALHRWPASRLVLEVTESAVTENPEQARAVVGALRARGIQVAVDDFGAGFTSLSRLRGLPVHHRRSTGSSSPRSTAHRTTTPWSPPSSTWATGSGSPSWPRAWSRSRRPSACTSLRCDDLQGFWFAKPMVADEVLSWASEHAANARATAPAPAVGHA
ncbi:hypothetical protein GCM10025868_10040 [Angustibacter aerolatus]|uniref:EAL domain-containing protein n=1 Tax=Angustibacter aerolatus TaxID=1162965 RepID=A0ABQ6JD97_9ACTN|nr:GGDEF domain-containing phosphodiesterase [Angustibacter aerolatus]GMA85754.1 hypothetical protein GCM10025868_10040 [Angustibacter aerolatus]